jgi:predicted aminopeptidase
MDDGDKQPGLPARWRRAVSSTSVAAAETSARGRSRALRLPWRLLVVALVLIATGCSSLGFYTQSVGGQLAILFKRRSVTAILADDREDATLREKLQRVLEAREFASRSLSLPDNGSYRSYVRLNRPYAVWNVVAAPALSVEPVTWCFPVAGCVSYRGYFSRARAERFAEKLRSRGYDAAVEGVAAYSTLGWFRDPVLSTFIDWPSPDLASLIFHELAHQRLYVKGDTVFNESFASVIEHEGLTRYLEEGGDQAALAVWEARHDRQRQFADLVLGHRERLRKIYASSSIATQDKLRRKREIFAEMARDYEDLKGSWGGYAGYDRWFDRELNNAHLASVGNYDRWVPAFEALLEDVGGDLRAFYDEVDALAKLKLEERRRRLSQFSSEPSRQERESGT